jgi:hypothetical protein
MIWPACSTVRGKLLKLKLGKFGAIPILCRNCKAAAELTSQNTDRSFIRSILALHKNIKFDLHFN